LTSPIVKRYDYVNEALNLLQTRRYTVTLLSINILTCTCIRHTNVSAQIYVVCHVLIHLLLVYDVVCHVLIHLPLVYDVVCHVLIHLPLVYDVVCHVLIHLLLVYDVVCHVLIHLPLVYDVVCHVLIHLLLVYDVVCHVPIHLPLVYDVVEKHRLVIEVESLASSSKKYITSSSAIAERPRYYRVG